MPQQAARFAYNSSSKLGCLPVQAQALLMSLALIDKLRPHYPAP